MNEYVERLINQFLPVKVDALVQEYIQHLGEAFTVLFESTDSAKSFAIMPLHILFMLSLQTVILRIYAHRSSEYKRLFVLRPPRNEDNDLLNPTEPFVIGKIGESEIANMLALIPVGSDVIKRIKELIRNRNDNLAHAKGGIERQLERKIDEYIDLLTLVFESLEKFDDEFSAKLTKERKVSGETALEILDRSLLGSFLCRANFLHGKLRKHFGVSLLKVD